MGAVSSSEYQALLENTPPYKQYDPDAPVVRVRHDAIVALVCICNALSRTFQPGLVQRKAQGTDIPLQSSLCARESLPSGRNSADFASNAGGMLSLLSVDTHLTSHLFDTELA